MEFKKLAYVSLFALTSMASIVPISTTQAAVVISDASYFVRPALRIGAGELIDGIEVNGVIESSNEQGVVGYSSSTVNLAEGTVKMYSEESSLLQGLQTFGSFGERVTITNGAGTNWDVGFAVDGVLDIFGGGAINDSVAQGALLYNVGIAVYEAGQVNWSNFVNNPDFDPIAFEFSEIVDPLNGELEFDTMEVFTDVFASIELESDYEQFDIFAYTNMIVFSNIGNGIESYEANFLNTASFSQTFANGVDAFSSSGQFMGLNTPAPNNPSPVNSPAMFGIFGLAFGLIVMKNRKQA